MVYKTGVFKNFAKFTEKPLCQCEIFKSTFFYRAPLVVPSDFSIKNYKWQYINFIRKSIKVFARLVISYVTKSNFSAKKYMSKVNNNDTRMTSIKVVLVFLLLTLNTYYTWIQSISRAVFTCSKSIAEIQVIYMISTQN